MTDGPVSTDTGQQRPATDDPLKTPAQFVRGVGPDRAELLAKLELHTAGDILFHMPRDVLDLSDVRQPSELEASLQQSVIGMVVDTESRQLSRGRTLTAILLRSGREFVRGVWFNQPWMLKKLRHDDVVLFSGKPKRNAGRWEFSNPVVQWLDVNLHRERRRNAIGNLKKGSTPPSRLCQKALAFSPPASANDIAARHSAA